MDKTYQQIPEVMLSHVVVVSFACTELDELCQQITTDNITTVSKTVLSLLYLH